MPSNPSSFTPLAGHRMLRKRSNSDRGHIHDGGVRRGTGRVARGLHNTAGVDDQRVRVALEREEGTDFERDFIKHTPLIPFMQYLCYR